MSSNPDKPIEEMTDRQNRRGISLRARITLATTLTAVLAAVSIGYFAFISNQATQKFLGDQFEQSVKERAESQIQALVSQEAQSINQYFNDVDQAVVSTAALTANLLNQTATFEEGVYWNATQKLSRLPSGAWDNPNDDLAAVFVPLNIDITENLIIEMNTAIQLDSIALDTLYFNPDIVGMYYISANNFTIYYPNINLANVVPPDFKATEQSFFTSAASINKNNSIWTIPYQDPALTGLIITNSSPVYDKNRKFRGVIGADVQLAKIKDRVEALEIGTTGYAILIDSSGHIIAMPDLGYKDFGLIPEVIPINETPQLTLLEQGPKELRLLFQSMVQGGTGFTRAQIHGTDHYLAYAPIISPKYSLGIIVPVSEMDTAIRKAQVLVAQENQQTQNFGLLLLVIVVVSATLISFGLSQVLTNPLNRLTTTAEQVRAGNLTAKAPETSVSEVNVLAKAFNTMTAQLREMVGGLEERVAERTAELETVNQQIQHRASQFEAIAQVARSISTSQDLETLLPTITNVISERFGFYHVGIFLLDAEKEFAVLRAANSTGGKRMLERDHKLKVGETGIVGYVTGHGKPRIVLDTGADTFYFVNPDLPETRSEIALPLIAGSQLIGALDVQSLEPNAFSQEDVNTLSTLADQVSIAIQNANLYEDTRQALAQSKALYQQFTQSGWIQFTRTQKLIGIRRSKTSATILREPLQNGEQYSHNSLDLPVNLRGHKIGSLKVFATGNRDWTQDDVDIASAIIERAAIALENARLLDEAQRRATREQIIGEITTKIGSSVNLRNVLQTAVEELGRSIPGSEILIELKSQQDNAQGLKSGEAK